MTSDAAAPGAALAAPGAPAPQRYQLCRHVHACVENGSLVFLGLKANRYWSVPLAGAPLIEGLTELCDASETRAARLVDLGLIEPAAGADRRRTRAPAPHRKIAPVIDARSSPRHTAYFWSACSRASYALATRRLDRTFDALAALRKRGRKPRLSVGAAVSVFEMLRPWYPHRRVCLFDALALTFFLSGQGIASELVIGVRTGPFAAHCWVEVEGALAGDMSDHCASFAPIAWV